MTPEQLAKFEQQQAEAQAEAPQEQPEEAASEKEVLSPAKHAMSKKQRPPKLQSAVDMAEVAAASFTFGIPQWFDTAKGGLINMAKGRPEPFKEAREDAFRDVLDARSRLTPTQEFLSSMAGGWQKRSAAGLLDNVLGLGADARRAPTALQRFGIKPGQIAISGGVGSVLDGYTAGEFTLEEAAQNGMMGALIAPAMQATLGDFALPLLKKRVQSLGVVDDFGGALDLIRATGVRRDKTLTTENIIAEANKLPHGASVIDIDTGDEWGGPAEAARRFHNAVAELSFGKVKDTEVNTTAFKYNSTMYNQALERMQDVAKQANERARADVTMALDAPESRTKALYNSKADLKAAKEVMSIITDQTPGKLGATPVDMRGIATDLNSKVAKAFGVSSGDITKASEGARKAVQAFFPYIRKVELNSAALSTHRMGSEGVDKLVNEGVDVFEGGNLAQLYNARKDYAADMLSPDSTATPSEKKAAVQVIKYVDEILEQRTLGAAGKSRGAFAKAMRMEEAYDMGQRFYSERMGEFADDKAFAKNFGDSVHTYMADLDDDMKEMFRAGFSKGMSQNIGKRGFLTEMNYLVGKYQPDPAGGRSFFVENEEGIKLMKTMLGEADTAKLLQVLHDGNAVAQYSNHLADLLARRGVDPEQAHPIIGDATSGILQHQSARNREAGAWDAALTSMDYILKPGDRQKARALIRLMAAESKGPPSMVEMSPWMQHLAKKGGKAENLTDLLNVADEQLNMLPVSMGGRGSNIAQAGMEGGERDAVADKREVDEAKRNIQEYLEELRGGQ